MTNKEAIEILTYMKNAYGKKPNQALDLAIKALEDRPQGEWIYERPNGKTHSDFVFCSICHKSGGFYKTNFCGNCGAEMVKGEKEE